MALLDFAELQTKPLKPAVTLSGLEHPLFPEILAAALPGVRHSRTSRFTERDEHSLVDPSSGSAVRIVIAWDRTAGRARTSIAEIGPRPLWDELVGCLCEWETHGRSFPEHWLGGAQRAALLISPQDEFHLDGVEAQIGQLKGGGRHRPQHRGAIEPRVPRQVPTRPISASEVDLDVTDKLEAVVTSQDQGVLALLAGQRSNAVARDYIHAHSTRYPDGHLYADLGGRLHGPVPPSVVLGGWLEALGCQEIPDELAERTSLFRQVTAGSHIAVLVDNAISAVQVRPLLPSSERSLTVVTSQWLLSGLLRDGAFLIDAGAPNEMEVAQ